MPLDEHASIQVLVYLGMERKQADRKLVGESRNVR